MRIARILLTVSATNGPYNQFTLPFASRQNILLILKDPPGIDIEDNVRVQHSNGNPIEFLFNVISLSSKKKFDFYHIHHANLAILAWVIKLFGLANGNRIVFTLGTCFQNLRFRHKLFLLLCTPVIDDFVCCGQSVYNSIPNSLKIFIGNKLHIIRHGINIGRTDAVLEQNPQKKSNSLMVATRLIKAKFVDQILMALASADTAWSLDIAGTGSEERNLKLISEQLGLQTSVDFRGFLSRDRVLQLMSRNQFYISASNTDGMPIAVLEAIGARCIPILVDSEPHLEIVREGIFALVFKRNDQQTLADALIAASNMEAVEIDKRSSANLEILKNKFSCEVMMNQYVNLVVQKQRTGMNTVSAND